MAVTIAVKPIDKILYSFPEAHEKSNGWWTHDDSPRFDFQENEDGHISIHPWTGRSAEDTLAMGNPPLKLADLYVRTSTGRTYQQQEKLDLLALSHYLKIEHGFLFALGYRDEYTYLNKSKGYKSVGVKLGGYCLPDGTPHSKNKIRLSVDPDKKFRFVWDENTPGEPIPCGLHTLPMAITEKYLVIGEGESDYATMMFHNFPFLGISGADSVKRLDVQLLTQIPSIYILEEPDQAQKNLDAGKGFYKNVRSHLRDNGYQGEIFSIRFKEATLCKDPSDLHKSLYNRIAMREESVFQTELKSQFAEAIVSALASAIPEGHDEEQKDITPYIPPMPSTAEGKLHWIMELLAVPSTVMSDSQKITLATIALHTPALSTQEKFKVDTPRLAECASQSRQTFLSNLSYLSKNVELFDKSIERRYHEDKDKKTKCSTDLYIEPAAKVWAAYPSTYRVAEGLPERKHGGKQTPRPKCSQCQSEELEVYETHLCRQCRHQESFRTDSLDEIPEIEPDDEPESNNVNLTFLTNEPETFIESTAQIEDDDPKTRNVNLTLVKNEPSEDETENKECQLDSCIKDLDKECQVDIPYLPQPETTEECHARWQREALEEAAAQEAGRYEQMRKAKR